MSNRTPIRFSEGLFSKGSHYPVIWTCPRCGCEFVKAYKNALKTKLCKPCNNIVRPKPDFSGDKNPFFGKTHDAETISGSLNANWRGGFPDCLECGTKLSDRRSEFCSKHFQLGDRNFKWNPTFDRKKREQLRITPEYITWAKTVKERDNFTCRQCGQIGGSLHSHHLKHWAKFPELRYELSNGITLCKSCHQDKHRKIKLNK